MVGKGVRTVRHAPRVSAPDGSLAAWHSRHHRKGLVRREAARAEAFTRLALRSAWMPGQLNWWIGTLFALGSIGFAIASGFESLPESGRVVCNRHDGRESFPVSSDAAQRLVCKLARRRFALPSEFREPNTQTQSDRLHVTDIHFLSSEDACDFVHAGKMFDSICTAQPMPRWRCKQLLSPQQDWHFGFEVVLTSIRVGSLGGLRQRIRSVNFFHAILDESTDQFRVLLN